MKNRERLNYIDQAKGIGILLIMIGHVSFNYGMISIPAAYYKIVLFYVISGMMISLNEKPNPPAMLGRIE